MHAMQLRRHRRSLAQAQGLLVKAARGLVIRPRVTPATTLLTVPELLNLSVPVCPRGAAGGTRRLRGFLASAGIGSKESSDAAGPAHRPERTRNGAAEVSARTHEHMRWTAGYPSQCALHGLEATVWPRARMGRRHARAGVPLALIRGLACEQQTITC